jgi:formiminoglutamate deiminase
MSESPRSTGRQRWHVPFAILPTGLARDVTFDVQDGRFAAITTGPTPGIGAREEAVETLPAETLPAVSLRLDGLALPGLANAHSHAFHRALRGRTHTNGGTFWSWREAMYLLAARLDPTSYRALATAVFAEMACAGITTVGEFHYLHHRPDGAPYAEMNAMAWAVADAAAAAGIRLTVLDTCYLAGGLTDAGHHPLSADQRRFGDGDGSSALAWAERFAALVQATEVNPALRVGAAIHSVRAVPRKALAQVVAAAHGRPLHVHVSEQPAENEACLRYYGCTPVELLADHGVLGPMTTLVHATHVAASDITTIGASRSTVCLCPTTERDLADGIGPARALVDAGSRLSLGTDQNAVIDPFEEARGLELHERLTSLQRGRFTPGEVLAAATRHDSLGWPDAGMLAVGARADLVVVATDSPRTAGVDPAQIVYAATASDVRWVMVDGQQVVTDGRHRLGAVGPLLGAAIAPLWEAR